MKQLFFIIFLVLCVGCAGQRTVGPTVPTTATMTPPMPQVEAPMVGVPQVVVPAAPKTNYCEVTCALAYWQRGGHFMFDFSPSLPPHWTRLATLTTNRIVVALTNTAGFFRTGFTNA